MRDDVDARGVEAELTAQPGGAVLGMDDDRVHPLVERALARELAPARLAREDVVGGQHARVDAREQQGVEVLHRQPLEVHDVRGTRCPPVAEHVRHVLREPRVAPAPGRRPAVERLAHADARRRGHVAIGERARPQLDVGARTSERRPECPVVGRRVGRRIDQVDAHGVPV